MKPPVALLAASTIVCVAVVFASEASATAFKRIDLISNQAGVAKNQDPDLVNSWGIAHAPGGPLWVADNETGLATVYDRKTGAKQGLTVTIPKGAPTGMAYVKQDDDNDIDFPISAGGNTGPSVFAFVSEAGLISGWNPDVDANNAVTAVDLSGSHAVFKGVAVAHRREGLYAADFHNNKVLRFGEQFQLEGTFTDPDLPKNFAPFNVAILNDHLYVAFAKREKDGDDEVDGKGLGYIDVFEKGGRLRQHLVANGLLNAPWGMTIAPSSFSEFAGALLVGNFGDGRINAFNPDNGEFLGTLTNAGGHPLKIDGLWALDAGPDGSVAFSAGPDDESNGLVGLIEPMGAKVALKKQRSLPA
jgi:uncharacterized protein (TIGR03118 family)